MGLRAKVICGLVLFFVIFGLRLLCANCQQIDVGTSSKSKKPQEWRSVPTALSIAEWDRSDKDVLSPNPYESWPGDETPLRRRRPGVRKRKRRPYTTEAAQTRGNYWPNTFSEEDRSEHFEDSSTTPQFKIFPERTIHLRDRNNDRFIDQKTSEPIWEHATTSDNIKPNRKPHSQEERDEEVNFKETTSPRPAVNLKNILKNSGGLSLSEILQQKNLSLEDLLKGKQNALLALQTTAVPLPKIEATTKYVKFIRKPGSRYPNSTEMIGNNTTRKAQPMQIEKSDQESPKIRETEPISVRYAQKDYSRNENRITENQSSASFEQKPPQKVLLENKTNLEHQYSKAQTELTLLKSSDNSRNNSIIDHNNSSNGTDDIYKDREVVEMATIATLRDYPMIRSSFNKTLQNIVFPTRHKFKLYITPQAVRSSTPTTTTPEVTSTTTLTPERMAAEVIRRNQTTIVEELNREENMLPHQDEIQFTPQFRKRAPIKPHPKVVPVFPDSPPHSSSTSLELSSDETSSDKFGEQFNEENSTNKSISNNSESIEDRLKDTMPEDNLIEQFPVSQSAQRYSATTLEELFNPIFHVQEKDHYLPITSRIDRVQTAASKGDVTERNPSLFLDITSDRTVDDRTDLLELIGDRRSGGRLFKVLQQRNMTLEELIEHRRRGSSQLHLAEIIQNKSMLLPEAAGLSSPLEDSLDIVTAFENFPHFNLVNLKSINPDEIKTDSQGSSYFTSIIDIEPTDEVQKDSRALVPFSALHSPNHKDPQTEDKQKERIIPQWDKLSLSNFNPQENSIDFKQGHLNHHSTNVQSKEIGLGDSVSRIEEEVAKAHDLLDLELSGHGFKRSTVNIESAQMPSGIRSAIVASSVIVGISLLVFLVIFAVCRWRQRRRTKLSYVENYTAIKSRIPIITRQNAMKHISENSSPIIFPGSKSCKLNTMDPNSPELQEYLFDTLRRDF